MAAWKCSAPTPTMASGGSTRTPAASCSVQVTPPGTHTPITVTVNGTVPPQTPWSDWFKLPGGLGQLKALRGADGRIILFGTNPGGNLYRSEQKVAKATQPNDWTGWVQMDNPVSGKIQLRTMAPVLDKAGAVNLFGSN